MTIENLKAKLEAKEAFFVQKLEELKTWVTSNNRKRKISGEDQESESNTSKSRKVSASSKSCNPLILDESEKEQRKTKNSVGAWKCQHCTKTCTTNDNLR